MRELSGANREQADPYFGSSRRLDPRREACRMTTPTRRDVPVIYTIADSLRTYGPRLLTDAVVYIPEDKR